MRAGENNCILADVFFFFFFPSLAFSKQECVEGFQMSGEVVNFALREGETHSSRKQIAPLSKTDCSWNKPDVTFHVLIGLFIKSQIFPWERHGIAMQLR